MLITLKSDGYSAKADTMGAELKSFQNKDGKEFVWNCDPAFWARCSPLLFPTIGNLRDGKTVINGREYELEKHGFIKTTEMDYEQPAENKARFSCRYNENTLKHYPFRFRLSLSYELKGSALFFVYTVSNEDGQEMYYHLGAHPGFMCPMAEGEVFSDYVLKFPYKETCDSPVYDLQNLEFNPAKTRRYLENSDTIKLDYSLFDDDALVFPHMKSRSVSLINPSTGRGVEMDYPDFCTIAFWTPDRKQAPFLCLEPWNGGAIYSDEDNHFKNKRDIQTLKPGESKEYRLTLRLLGW